LKKANLSAFKDCDQVLFEAVKGTPATADTNDKARNNVATAIGKYSELYDVRTTDGLRADKAATSATDLPKVKDFMRMVWKDQSNVSIGYHKKKGADTSFVVMWFCDAKIKDNFAAHNKDVDGTKVANRVGLACHKYPNVNP